LKIVRTSPFEKSLKKLGASKADLAKMEAEIANNPEAGDVIPGLYGARKIRFSMAGRGKRGGGRTIYVVIWDAETAYLLLAYDKKDQSDISEKQAKAIAAVMKEMPNGEN
jgi:hypothetical protein